MSVEIKFEKVYCARVIIRASLGNLALEDIGHGFYSNQFEKFLYAFFVPIAQDRFYEKRKLYVFDFPWIDPPEEMRVLFDKFFQFTVVHSPIPDRRVGSRGFSRLMGVRL